MKSLMQIEQVKSFMLRGAAWSRDTQNSLVVPSNLAFAVWKSSILLNKVSPHWIAKYEQVGASVVIHRSVMPPLGQALTIMLMESVELLNPMYVGGTEKGIVRFFAKLHQYYLLFSTFSEQQVAFPFTIADVTAFYSGGSRVRLLQRLEEWRVSKSWYLWQVENEAPRDSADCLWEDEVINLIDQEAALLMLWSLLKWLPSSLLPEMKEISEQVWLELRPRPWNYWPIEFKVKGIKRCGTTMIVDFGVAGGAYVTPCFFLCLHVRGAST